VSEYSGTGELLRLFVRRDRIRLALWASLSAVYAPFVQAPAMKALYPDAASLERAAADFDRNATFRMLYGRIPSPTVAGLTEWRCSFLLIVLGVACILTVVRHTRADEQGGRAELVCSGGVGRRAPLAAAVALAIGASTAVALTTGLGMVAMGADAVGSLAYGLQLLLAGVLCSALGALAAQLSEGAGAARGIPLALLAGMYLVRALGDAKAHGGLAWLSWLSPIGWLHQLEPYGRERWWVLALPVVLTIAVLVGAVALSVHRDFGGGILPGRLGPPEAAPSLRSPLALAWRVQRGALVGWAAGLAFVGAVLGGAATSADDFLRDANPQVREAFERLGGSTVVIDAFLAAVFGLLGILAAAQAVQIALRLRAQEEQGLAEPLLVASVGRPRWAAGHVLFVGIGPALSLAVAGLAGAVTFGLADHHLVHDLAIVMRAAVVQLPAVWTVGAAAVLLFGLAPRWSAAGWALVGACFTLGQVGAALGLDQWILDLSPFTHVPALPGHAFWLPIGLLAGAAGALAAAGVVAFAHRDLT
jgi:ABC-2 type transport system permease protein